MWSRKPSVVAILAAPYLWCMVGVATLLFVRIHAELFTAISDVEPLLETHKKIIDGLNDYVNREEERLKLLKKHLDLYKVEQTRAMEDIPNYLGNPINAFTLIKRLTTDLDNLEEGIKKGTDYTNNITRNHPGVKYPTREDLTGAAQALTRLQNTYHLKVSDLAEGKLNGVIYSTPMLAGDCYELGRALYNEKDYKNALSWMMEAHRKFKEENELYPFTEGDILEYISFSHNLLGDTRAAMEWTMKLLEVDPNHPRARGNIPHYQKIIGEEDEKLKKNRRGNVKLQKLKLPVKGESQVLKIFIDEIIKVDIDISEEEVTPNPLSWPEDEKLQYEALCRGEIDIPADVSKRLRCRYLAENHPFLKLAPIKMEQMYIKPDIVVFYDVLSEEESEHIKELAKPRFKRAGIVNDTTGESITTDVRISKSSWLADNESPIVARVSQRVADFTGLSLESAENLQVANYGIGGHYEPHYDCTINTRLHAADKTFTSNRIATVLFYMSDVAQGGATVFTELGLSVFPVARAAAFWLNLHPSGEGDLATRHAACPVLRGSKWVCNKWIHQTGQELIKPCDLEYQKEGIARQIPKPVPKSFI